MTWNQWAGVLLIPAFLTIFIICSGALRHGLMQLGLSGFMAVCLMEIPPPAQT